jgi:signal transduction histidine kinase
MAEQPDNLDGEHRRRSITRRSNRMGFGGSVRDSTSGLGNIGSGDPELVEDINAQVAARVGAIPRNAGPQAAPEAPEGDPDDMEDGFNPLARLRQAAGRSTEYEREYRLDLLNRMLMRNLPLDEIANSLGVTVRQIQRDRKELQDRLRKAARDLDIDEIIGGSTSFYQEVQAMSMRAASSRQTPTAMKLGALRVALAAHNDKHRMMQAAGVYDALRFRKGADGAARSDIQRLLDVTDDLLTEARRERRVASGENALGDFSNDDEDEYQTI